MSRAPKPKATSTKAEPPSPDGPIRPFVSLPDTIREIDALDGAELVRAVMACRGHYISHLRDVASELGAGRAYSALDDFRSLLSARFRFSDFRAALEAVAAGREPGELWRELLPGLVHDPRGPGVGYGLEVARRWMAMGITVDELVNA